MSVTNSRTTPQLFCVSRVFRIAALLPLAAIVSAQPASTVKAQVLIPISDRVEHVFDDTRNLLYVTTTSGTVERWSVDSQMLLSPFTGIGSSLSDIDVTIDGSFAYVGDATAGATAGFIRKVDLSDGSRTNLTYNLDRQERGVDELVISNNGKAFFTTNFSGSGWNPLREINLSTDSLSPRTDALGSGFGSEVRQSTGIARGPDRSLLFFQESNISSGPIFTYSGNTDSFIEQRNTSSFVGNLPAAVNRNGTLIAFRGSLLDPNLDTVELLPGTPGGYQFDPLQDILYIADTSSNEIIAVDSSNAAELDRFPIGESISGNNRMSISSDSRFLFVTTNSGVRQISNPLAVPEPKSMAILLIGTVSLAFCRTTLSMPRLLQE